MMEIMIIIQMSQEKLETALAKMKQLEQEKIQLDNRLYVAEKEYRAIFRIIRDRKQLEILEKALPDNCLFAVAYSYDDAPEKDTIFDCPTRSEAIQKCMEFDGDYGDCTITYRNTNNKLITYSPPDNFYKTCGLPFALTFFY